jgi:hypothetical protein
MKLRLFGAADLLPRKVGVSLGVQNPLIFIVEFIEVLGVILPDFVMFTKSSF